MGLMTHSGDKGDGRSCDDETLTRPFVSFMVWLAA
jgi:hypothetical protein